MQNTVHPKGTTLMELLITVVIIGILSTIAFGGYARMTENRRDREAQDALGAIFQAERLYHLRNDTYTDDWIDLQMADPSGDDWAYTFTGVTATAFTATATRQGAGNRTIVIDETFNGF